MPQPFVFKTNMWIADFVFGLTLSRAPKTNKNVMKLEDDTIAYEGNRIRKIMYFVVTFIPHNN